jgi:hypothetical protein
LLRRRSRWKLDTDWFKRIEPNGGDTREADSCAGRGEQHPPNGRASAAEGGGAAVIAAAVAIVCRVPKRRKKQSDTPLAQEKVVSLDGCQHPPFS